MKIKAAKQGWGSRSVKRLLRKMDFAGIEWPYHPDDTRIQKLSGAAAARWKFEAKLSGISPWIGSDDRVSDCLKGCTFVPSDELTGYRDCDIIADSILEEKNPGHAWLSRSIQELIDSFSARISKPRGECFEASVSLGILLAAESFPVRLIRGKCCGRKHWWLCHHGSIIDPTAHQFDGDKKYVQEERHPMDFDSLAGYLNMV